MLCIFRTQCLQNVKSRVQIQLRRQTSGRIHVKWTSSENLVTGRVDHPHWGPLSPNSNSYLRKTQETHSHAGLAGGDKNWFSRDSIRKAVDTRTEKEGVLNIEDGNDEHQQRKQEYGGGRKGKWWDGSLADVQTGHWTGELWLQVTRWRWPTVYPSLQCNDNNWYWIMNNELFEVAGPKTMVKLLVSINGCFWNISNRNRVLLFNLA